MTPQQLTLANLEQLVRLATYLGVQLPKRRGREGDYQRALAHAIAKHLKRTKRKGKR